MSCIAYLFAPTDGLSFLMVVVAIFWMVVGWRAMRAHERLADAAAEIAKKTVCRQPPD